MKKLISLFLDLNDFGNIKDEYKTDLIRLLNRLLLLLLAFTMVLWIILFWFTHKINAIAHLTFLGVAAACLFSGIAFGFLFGIPRAVKYRTKPSGPDGTVRDNLYDDNTNLEEISDWLTKIIVGLTLIKFNTILSWINKCALSMGAALSGKPPCLPDCSPYYVFSYATIVLYFTVGLGTCYLWTRTYFMLILIQNKKLQEKLEKEEITKKQADANKEMTESAVVGADDNAKRMIIETQDDFMNKVKETYKLAPVTDKTDPQKDRWGRSSANNGWKLFANVDADRSYLGLYKLILSIKSADGSKQLEGMAAFFLHDTFPREIVFVPAENGAARLEVTSYEAFTVGAMLQDGTTLELDLNEVPGFPKGFYWTK